MNSSRISLKVVATALVFLAVGAYLGWRTLGQASHHNQEYYAGLLEQRAGAVGRQLSLFLSYADMLASSAYVRQALESSAASPGPLDPAAKKALGRVLNLVASQPDFLDAFILDRNGRCIAAASGPEAAGGDRMVGPYFNRALYSGHGISMASGAGSGRIRFFAASRVDARGGPLGVAVLKVSGGLFNEEEAPHAVLPGSGGLLYPLSALATREGVIFCPHNELFTLSEPTSRVMSMLARTGRFPPGSVKSLGFPRGTWTELVEKGSLRSKNLKDGAWYHLYRVPLGLGGLSFFHAISEEDFNSSFWHVMEPLYTLTAAFVCVLLAMVFLYHLLEVKHRALGKALEELRREHENHGRLLSRYEAIIENTNEGFWVVDASDFSIREVNRALCAMLGYPPGEIIGKTPFDLVDEENRKLILAHASRKDNDRCVFEIELLTSDGDKRFVRINSTKVSGRNGEPDFRFAFLTDLSDYVRSQKEVRKLSTAVEQSAHSVIITDKDGVIEYVNPKFCEVSGYSREEILGRNPRILKSGHHDQDFYRRLWETVQSGQVWHGELCNRRKDGSLYWERASIAPVRDERGEVSNFIAIKEDITQWKKMQEELKELATELNLIVENVGIGIAHIQDRKVVHLNKEMARLYGASPEELVGRDTSFIFPSREAYEEFGKTAYPMLAQEGSVSCELVLKRADGTQGWARISGKALVPGDPHAGSVWILEDITERKEMEASIARKDAILEAVSHASRQFLTNDDWESVAKDVLSHLGAASSMHAGFICLCQGETAGGLHLKTMAEWSSDAGADAMDGGWAVRGRKLIGRWLGRFREGRAVYGAAEGFPEEEKALLLEAGMRSLVVCPVTVDGELWGLMGFVDREEARTFSHAELDALHSAANVLAGAIWRRQSELIKGIEELRYTTIVQNAKSIILRMDNQGRIRFMNRFGLEFFGYSSEDLVGKSVLGTILPETPEAEEALGALLGDVVDRAEEYVCHENENITSDGRSVWISWTNTSIRDERGKVIELLCIGHDVSARKQMEKELERAKIKAEEASKAKSRFLANISHEIRTPLNAVMGMAELAMKTELTPEQAKYLSAIESGASTLLALINDILDLSKAEAGQMVLEERPFSLRDVMEESVELMASAAHEKDLDILCHLPPSVPVNLVGDSLRLRQILLNLLGNAVKFTDKGYVVLHCHLEGADNRIATLHFKVIDTGIGIEAGKQKDIFDAFTQADTSVSRRFGGTGLGLNLCRKLTELMGGRIWVDSAAGEGSTFHFTARFKVNRDVADGEDLPAGPLLGEHPVLVVARNEWIVRIVKDLLVPLGSQVEEVRLEDEAALLLRSIGQEAGPHRMVLLDEGMLGDEVVGALEDVRGSSAGPRKASVFLMTRAFQEHYLCKKLSSCGFTGCVPKPITRERFVRELFKGITDSVPAGGGGAPAGGTAGNRGTAAARILLVEDNELNRQLALSVLEGAGHTVEAAEDGEAALRRLAGGKRYDIVLMDVQMPGLDGITTTRVIRECERGGRPTVSLDERLLAGLKAAMEGGHVPIVAMTAHAFKEDMESCLEAGMDDYITKPFRLTDVVRVINQVLFPEGGGRLPVDTARDRSGATPSWEPIGIDQARAHLVRVYGLSEAQLDAMLDAASRSVEAGLAKGMDAASREDHQEVWKAAHALKGTLLNLGADRLAEFARDLEVRARRGEGFGYKEAFERLEAALSPLLRSQTPPTRG